MAVIGDGALTGGLAYEALNNASALKSNIIIVLNDNNMSISENVGGLSETLGALRTADGYMGLKDNIKNALNKIPGGSVIEKGIHRTKEGIKQAILPGMFFEELGIKYLGPIDGHDMQKMLRAFNEASRVEGPVVVHVITKSTTALYDCIPTDSMVRGGLPLIRAVPLKGKSLYPTVMYFLP